MRKKLNPDAVALKEYLVELRQYVDPTRSLESVALEALKTEVSNCKEATARAAHIETINAGHALDRQSLKEQIYSLKEQLDSQRNRIWSQEKYSEALTQLGEIHAST